MKSASLNRKAVRSMCGSLIVGAALIATSAVTYAQTSLDAGTHPLTRAEVRHELEELESVGYNPAAGDDPDYPAALQAAEHRLEVKHQEERNALASTDPTSPAKAAH
jgi:Domain of unknown function (DUF4148)